MLPALSERSTGLNPLISLLNDVIVILFTLAICTRIFSLRKKNLFYKTLMYGGCAAIFLVYALAAGFYGMASLVASVLCVGVPGLFLFLASQSTGTAGFASRSFLCIPWPNHWLHGPLHRDADIRRRQCAQHCSHSGALSDGYKAWEQAF